MHSVRASDHLLDEVTPQENRPEVSRQSGSAVRMPRIGVMNTNRYRAGERRKRLRTTVPSTTTTTTTTTPTTLQPNDDYYGIRKSCFLFSSAMNCRFLRIRRLLRRLRLPLDDNHNDHHYGGAQKEERWTTSLATPNRAAIDDDDHYSVAQL